MFSMCFRPSPFCSLAACLTEASTNARTGVEIETLIALSIAGTTIIDMTKALDRTGRLESIRVVEKSGGRSGHWIEKREND